MRKKLGSFFMIISICFFIIGAILIYKGFDKKNNYHYSESIIETNTNAYVGGDAYNYIINSNYFTGYIVLGSTMLLIGTIFFIYGNMYVHVEKGLPSKEIDNSNYDTRKLPPL